jgi:glycosyltransferase involved in cell wall biosynthesis
LKLKLNSKNENIIFPKSVCYIIPTTNITGGVAVVCEHLNRLKKLGFKTLIASYDNKIDLSWFPNQQVKIIPLKNNQKIIEQYQTVVATGWITAYELLLLNVKQKIYLVQSDETLFYPKCSYLKNRVKRTYTFPFKFITVAKWLQSFLKENFNKNSIYVPNGIDTNIFHSVTPLVSKPKNKKRILLEGAINLPFKGMTEAFKVVQDMDCEVWCVSYDGKPQSKWHCDLFFEKVPMQDMPKIYSSCDILLKLSQVESFGYPPLEMMACGGVSVVSDIKGHHEYGIDQYNLLFTDPKNISKTKKIVESLIKNKKLYQKIQTNSQNTVKQFNWPKTIKTLERIFS